MRFLFVCLVLIWSFVLKENMKLEEECGRKGLGRVGGNREWR